MDWIREHPYLTGGGILGVIILYFILSSGSSSSSSVASNGVGGTGLSSSDYASLQEAQLSTAAGLQAQQTQASAQISQYNAELAATQIQANASTTAAQLASNDTLQQTLTAGQVTENTNQYAYQSAVAQIGGQVQLGAQSTQAAELATTTQGQTQQDEYAQATAQDQLISDAQTAQAQINGNTQTAIAGYASQVQLATVNGQTQLGLANIGAQNLVTTTTGNVTLAGINAQQSVDNNEINAQSNIDANETTTYANEFQNVLNTINSGVLNKGGSGGANQVSILSTLLGGSGQAPTPQPAPQVTIPGLASFTI